MNPSHAESREHVFDPAAVSRPDPVLLKYYLIVSLFTGPLFPFVFLPLYFKYHTMKYRLDNDGISMSWGIMFRKEIHLTYRRIQDIHLTRNFVQRWLGLATVAVQTASGKAGPEMSIEGILEAAALRDYLYLEMRGARDDVSEDTTDTAADGAADPGDAALGLLREIRDLLQTRSTGETS